jgi:hypothetical protein
LPRGKNNDCNDNPSVSPHSRRFIMKKIVVAALALVGLSALAMLIAKNLND